MIGRRQFLGSGTTAIALSACAATPLSAALTSPKAVGDIALLREILTTLHPGLYRYSSPKAIEAALRQLDRQWAAQPDLAARYLNLSRFLSMIKCGHSYANFFNQSRKVSSQLFDPPAPTRLPFAFKWIERKMVVTQDQSGTGLLKRGAVIKKVNGVPVGTILDNLMPYVRADGSNDGKRRALLSIGGSEDIQTFDVFYGLIYGPPGQAGRHRLLVREPEAKNDVRIDVTAITMAQRQSYIKRPDKGGTEPIWEWKLRPDNIAVLTMASWAMFDSKWKWEDWLNERLDSLPGAKGLIVDIRGNEGGNSCGDVILSRLADKPIAMPLSRRLVRYKKVPEHLNQYLNTWDDGFRDWGDNLRPYDDQFFEQVDITYNPVVEPKGPRINVPMAVLISPQNSSATFQFALKCRLSGLGALIGETTGGNLRGINGGYFFATLPDSGIEFDVALVGYYPDGPMPRDAGLDPDIKVSLTAKDIAQGNDPQMAAAASYLLTQ